MEANELRIGNMLHFPFTNENIEVLGINAHEENFKIINSISFKKESNLYCEKISVLKAIPLTEEWLLKFGYWKLDNKDIHFVTKGHTIWKCDNLFMCDKNGLIIKSVHQLQNLYFALNKEELILNKIL